MASLIISVAEMKQHIATPLGDDALERLIDAAEDAINSVCGDAANQRVWETHADNEAYLFLPHRAISVESITVNGADMSEDDYSVRHEGRAIMRAKPRDRWDGSIVVTYITPDTRAQRRTALIRLVRLEAEYLGYQSQSIGGASISYAPYEEERQTLLGALKREITSVLI